MPPDRRRVIYQGRVQGVGFRFTAARLAPGFSVSGTVRNRPDGSVELEVQGDRDQVRAFLTAIQAEFGPNIDRADETCLPLESDSSQAQFRILD